MNTYNNSNANPLQQRMFSSMVAPRTQQTVSDWNQAQLFQSRAFRQVELQNQISRQSSSSSLERSSSYDSTKNRHSLTTRVSSSSSLFPTIETEPVIVPQPQPQPQPAEEVEEESEYSEEEEEYSDIEEEEEEKEEEELEEAIIELSQSTRLTESVHNNNKESNELMKKMNKYLELQRLKNQLRMQAAEGALYSAVSVHIIEMIIRKRLFV